MGVAYPATYDTVCIAVHDRSASRSNHQGVLQWWVVCGNDWVAGREATQCQIRKIAPGTLAGRIPELASKAAWGQCHSTPGLARVRRVSLSACACVLTHPLSTSTPCTRMVHYVPTLPAPSHPTTPTHIVWCTALLLAHSPRHRPLIFVCV